MSFKLDNKAIARLRTSGAVSRALEDLAEDAVRGLSENGRVKGYSYSLQLARENRSAVTIVGKGHALNSNNVHGSLMRALDSVAEDVKKGKGRR